MNERIRELAGQTFYWEGDGMFSGQVELEQFAELIVRECMACSTWVGKVNMNAIEPVHTAHAINQRIKEHFGVEE